MDANRPAVLIEFQRLGHARRGADAVARSILPVLDPHRSSALPVTRWLRTKANPPNADANVLAVAVSWNVFKRRCGFRRATELRGEVRHLVGKPRALVI